MAINNYRTVNPCTERLGLLEGLSVIARERVSGGADSHDDNFDNRFDLERKISEPGEEMIV